MIDHSQWPEYLTIGEAAELIRVHPNTLRNWEKGGYLVPVRLGVRRDRRYATDDIRRLMQR